MILVSMILSALSAVTDSRYKAGCGRLFLYQREMGANYGGAEPYKIARPSSASM